MKRKLMLLGLVLLMVTSLLAGCGDKKQKNEGPVQEKDDKQVSDANLKFDGEGYAEVTSNSKYTLSVNKDGSSIRVKDNATNAVWDTAVSSPDFDKEQVNDKWRKKMTSPFEVFYTDLESGHGAVINLSLLEMDYTAQFKKFENGVRVIYDMKNPGIVMAVDYSIDDSGLVVEVPTSTIEEKGKYSLTSVKMLSYIADATDTQEGYYLYPDGSGAIMEFQDSSHYKESELALPLYGDLTDYKNTLDVLAEKSSQVLMPVYGASLPDKAFLAIIEKGAETATVKVLPSTEVIPLNSIACEFAFRRSFADARATDQGFLVFDDEMIPGTRKIAFHFFDEKDVTYADMAKVYREYLTQELGVQQNVQNGDIALSLDLFMGIKEDGLLFDEFKSVTSFDQAQEILEKLQKGGVDNIELQLRGWTKKGYYTDPVMFPASSKLGGNSGLKKLTEYAADKNIEVALEANFLEARAESGGYNEREDVLYLGNNSIFSNFDSSLFLMAPHAAEKNLDDFIKDAEKFKINGVSFYGMGEYLFYNYNGTDYTTQEQCAAVWQSMLQKSKDKFGKAIVQGGNSYVLPVADKVTDLPYEDSGYQMTTRGVPFYQIAVHGLVSYTGKAGNLSSDIEKEKLKWVEYGYTPYFELTYGGSEDLMYTDYSTLFSSAYEDWMDEATEIYKEFNENFKDIWTAQIEDHEELRENVYKVTYDNGTKVYVNYNQDKVTVEGVTIDAKDYVVKEG